MTLSIVALLLIITYEIYRLIRFKSYSKTLFHLKSFKGEKLSNGEFKIKFEEIMSDGFKIHYVILEFAYTFTLFILLFTQYLPVALLLIIQSVLVSTLILKGKNRTYMASVFDGLLTIVIIVGGIIYL